MDSSNMVFGETKIFELEEIRIFNIIDGDSIFLSKGESFYEGVFTFEIVDFNATRVFIDYANSDIDTLDVTFGTIDGGCCDGNRFLDSVLQNNVSVFNRLIGSNFTVLIK